MALVVTALASIGALQASGNWRLLFVSLFGLVAVVAGVALVVRLPTVRFHLAQLEQRRAARKFITFCYPWTHKGAAPAAPTRLHFDVVLILPAPDQTRDAMAQYINTPGLRCEVRRWGRPTRYLCSRIHVGNSGGIRSQFPQELTISGDDLLRVANGLWIIRWKRDGRWRAVAKDYLWHDGQRYRLHPWVWVVVHWREYRRKVGEYHRTGTLT